MFGTSWYATSHTTTATAPPLTTRQCEKHSKKEEALAKLNEGVKFDEVARTYSEDKARQGGALGWKTKGSLDPKFEEVAFALEPSTTASPRFAEVKTGFGYHIIMVRQTLGLPRDLD
jgi:parvulin-like peptidyl-prolyl isomerase